MKAKTKNTQKNRPNASRGRNGAHANGNNAAKDETPQATIARIKTELNARSPGLGDQLDRMAQEFIKRFGGAGTFIATPFGEVSLLDAYPQPPADEDIGRTVPVELPKYTSRVQALREKLGTAKPSDLTARDIMEAPNLTEALRRRCNQQADSIKGYQKENHTLRSDLDVVRMNRDASIKATRVAINNKLLCKAQEMMSRPKVHPCAAILEAIAYAGLEIPQGYDFESIKKDCEKQFREAFPELAKERDELAKKHDPVAAEHEKQKLLAEARQKNKPRPRYCVVNLLHSGEWGVVFKKRQRLGERYIAKVEHHRLRPIIAQWADHGILPDNARGY